MKPIQKTYKELLEIDSVVAEIFDTDPASKGGKFAYAYKRFFKKNIEPLATEFNEKLQDFSLEQALVDEKTKEILYTDGNQRQYKFDKEGTKKIVDFKRKLTKEYNDKVVDIAPFITKDVPNLTEEQVELLKGLII